MYATPRHAALAAQVSKRALLLADLLRRDWETKYDAPKGRRQQSDRVKRITKCLRRAGYRVLIGAGIEKPYVLLGAGHVLKIGDAEVCKTEARVSEVCKRGRLIATTVELRRGIIAQERADILVAHLRDNYEALGRPGELQYDKIWGKRVSRFATRCSKLGFGDTHGRNIGVYSDGSLKLFDPYAPHAREFLARVSRFGKVVRNR